MIDNSIVSIRKENSGAETGFFVSSQGHILTCLHVLNEAMHVCDNEKEEYSYTHNKQSTHFRAVKIAVDEKNDLALLKTIHIHPKDYEFLRLERDDYI